MKQTSPDIHKPSYIPEDPLTSSAQFYGVSELAHRYGRHQEIGGIVLEWGLEND